MPPLHGNDEQWRNVSVNIVANSNWSYFVISAVKVHWTVQPTAARQSGRFNKMHPWGSARIARVSLRQLSANAWKETTTT